MRIFLTKLSIIIMFQDEMSQWHEAQEEISIFHPFIIFNKPERKGKFLLKLSLRFQMFPEVIFLFFERRIPQGENWNHRNLFGITSPQLRRCRLIKLLFIFICSRCHPLSKKIKSLRYKFKTRKQTCAIFSQFGLQTDSWRRNVFKNKHISQITDDMINGF